MKNVIFFGMGSVCDMVEQIIDCNKVNIIAYTDNSEIVRVKGRDGQKIIRPEEIKKYNYSHIIIASSYFDEIYNQLTKMGISEKKIVNGFSFYTSILRLELFLNKNYDAFITGLSYAYGIHEERLDKLTANLAYPGQDIQLDFYLAKSIILHKSKKPQTAIIGLAYNSFHYEFMSTRETKDTQTRLRRMVIWPGLIKRARLAASNLHINDYKKKLYHHRDKTVSHYVDHSDLFLLDFASNRGLSLLKRTEEKVIKNITLEQRRYLANLTSSKKHMESFERNVGILIEYIRFLKFHNIFTVIVVHPQHPDFARNFNEEMKGQFLTVINNLKEDFDFQYIDCFDSYTTTNEDFKDEHHLNFAAERKFTDYLNKVIKWT